MQKLLKLCNVMQVKQMNNNDRCYSELVILKTFDERFRYLKMSGTVGLDTFGYDRYLNQTFYKSSEWKRIRNEVIVRDNGCDLGIDGYEITGTVIVHHMIPITKEMIVNRNPIVFNKEYLITVSLSTHNAIHYGNDNYADTNNVVIRHKNDMCPWKTQ